VAGGHIFHISDDVAFLVVLSPVFNSCPLQLTAVNYLFTDMCLCHHTDTS